MESRLQAISVVDIPDPAGLVTTRSDDLATLRIEGYLGNLPTARDPPREGEGVK